MHVADCCDFGANCLMCYLSNEILVGSNINLVVSFVGMTLDCVCLHCWLDVCFCQKVRL